jgi:hypothetical protein
VFAVARRMTGYVYEAGGDIIICCPSSCHGKIVGSLRQVWHCQLSSLFKGRSAGSEARLHDSTTLRSHAHRDGDGRTKSPLARLGIGFAESHAAPHERALGSCGSLLSAASNAQHPPARSSNPVFLYDIAQRSETRASPYNTFTSAKESPYQPASLYSLFVSAKVRAGSISYQVAMDDHVFIEQLPRGM